MEFLLTASQCWKLIKTAVLGFTFHICSIDQVLCWFYWIMLFSFFFFLFFQFYFIFKLYIIVLVLPNIKMNPPQVYMCSPSRTLLPPPTPYHPSGPSQCTSPKHPASCIEPGLAYVIDAVPFSSLNTLLQIPPVSQFTRPVYTSSSLWVLVPQTVDHRIKQGSESIIKSEISLSCSEE